MEINEENQPHLKAPIPETKTFLTPPLSEAYKTIRTLSTTNPKDILPGTKPRIFKAFDTLAQQGLSSNDDKTFIFCARTLIDFASGAPTKGGQDRPFEYRGPNQDLFEYALVASHTHFNLLVAQLKSSAPDAQIRERQEQSMHLINLMAKKQLTTQMVDDAYTIYRALRPDIIKGVLTGKFNFDEALDLYLNKYPKTIESVLRAIKKQGQQIMQSQYNLNLLHFFNVYDEHRFNIGERIATAALGKIGIGIKEAKTLFFLWKVDLFHPRSSLSSGAIGDNVRTMFELEQLSPGSVKWLREVYGVTHFGRYPNELLLEQYKNRDEGIKPWGLMIFPYADHNIAFHNKIWLFLDFKESLEQIAKSGGPSYNIRILETKNLYSMAKRLIKLHQNYGPASFAIIAGHGSPNTIAFGSGWRPGERITTEQFKNGNGIARAVQRFFMPHAPIALFSCSTGKERGIANAFASLGPTVVAPDADSEALQILPSYDNENLKIDILYRDAQAKKYTKPSTEISAESEA